jgi:hypothetical protein
MDMAYNEMELEVINSQICLLTNFLDVIFIVLISSQCILLGMISFRLFLSFTFLGLLRSQFVDMSKTRHRLSNNKLQV